jgi:regulator of protease activity HflC (stomatin/prohibitin superfamily)
MDYVAAALLGALVLWISTRATVMSTTIFEYQRGLRFVNGALRDEVGAGRHWHLGSGTTIRTFDLRSTTIAVNSQEVLSKDGVAVKASLSAMYRIAQPRIAVLSTTDFAAALYVELQQALRAAVSMVDVEALLANRGEIGGQILAVVQPAAERSGLMLEHVAVRDLTFPGELKKIFAQVVKARQEGLATLERARGETAALRHLANAASMVERNPHLYALRVLQVAGQQPGATLVVGLPGAGPLPLATIPRSPNEPASPESEV